MAFESAGALAAFGGFCLFFWHDKMALPFGSHPAPCGLSGFFTVKEKNRQIQQIIETVFNNDKITKKILYTFRRYFSFTFQFEKVMSKNCYNAQLEGAFNSDDFNVLNWLKLQEAKWLQYSVAMLCDPLQNSRCSS